MSAETWSHQRIRGVLKTHTLFEPMPEPDLEAMIAAANLVELDPDEILFDEDAPSDSVGVILRGEIEVQRKIGSTELPLATRRVGETIGETGVLTGSRRSATVVARVPTTVLAVPGEAFLATLAHAPEGTLHLLVTVISRLQEAENELVAHQKLAALGVLAGGLAHELNNPAAALDRGARQLRDHVADLEGDAVRIGRLGLGDAAYARLEHRRDAMLATDDGLSWDPIERSDREARIEARLDRLGIPSPWTTGPALVEAGWDVDDLDEMSAEHGGNAASVVQWLASSSSVARLLQRLGSSAHSISEIVSSVKSYTRLDEAPVQEVDIHEGIDQSLTMLGHKLQSVRVTRDYAPDLPRIRAHGGELNQVWTNLINNAADAMQDAGDLSISTRLDTGAVVVEVTDSGPGVPEDVQRHMFDPFFTTKPPGSGTGMGLSVTHTIVRRRGGTIAVTSRPGRTTFRVRIPLVQETP